MALRAARSGAAGREGRPGRWPAIVRSRPAVAAAGRAAARAADRASPARLRAWWGGLAAPTNRGRCGARRSRQGRDGRRREAAGNLLLPPPGGPRPATPLLATAPGPDGAGGRPSSMRRRAPTLVTTGTDRIRGIHQPPPGFDAGCGGRKRQYRPAAVSGRVPVPRDRLGRCTGSRSGTPRLVQQLRAMGRRVRAGRGDSKCLCRRPVSLPRAAETARPAGLPAPLGAVVRDIVRRAAGQRHDRRANGADRRAVEAGGGGIARRSPAALYRRDRTGAPGASA